MPLGILPHLPPIGPLSQLAIPWGYNSNPKDTRWWCNWADIWKTIQYKQESPDSFSGHSKAAISVWLAEIFLDSVLSCSTSVAWFSTTSDVLLFCLPLEWSIALKGLPFRNSHGRQVHFPTFIYFYSFIRDFSDHCFRGRISWFSNQDQDTEREILRTRRRSLWEFGSRHLKKQVAERKHGCNEGI